MENVPVISFCGVTKRFPGVVALENVSIDIAPAELHAVVGENGAGKSTLVKCLSGAIVDYEGTLRLRGRPLRFHGTADAERAGVGIIHQELNLVGSLSAAANVFLGREKRTRFGWLDDRAMERATANLLARLECRIDPRAMVGGLRIGDQQLVEIAKALSLEPDILIMDEPTSALCDAEVARLFRVIRRLRGRGVTILYISHKMDEVFRLADRITILRDGCVVSTLGRSDTNPREVTHRMVGREIQTHHPNTRHSPGKTVLETRGLSLPWPGHARKWRLQNVGFTLRRGEIVGLAGLMGSGRTELMECLFGASDDAPSGEIRLEGRPVVFRHPQEAMRAGIALVTEDRKRLGLFPNLDVGHNITLCTLREVARCWRIDSSRERDMAARMAAEMDVKPPGMDTPIALLSGGNQQKAILGRWLLTKPKILLLDDPTRGVDVGAKAELYTLVRKLCGKGLGILMTSSELPELLTLCDRILVLCEGRLAGQLPRAEATEQRIMELAHP